MTAMRAVIASCLVAVAQPVFAQSADDFVGRWGLASYWEDKHAQPAQGWARAACSAPYVITKSPSGNLLMHIADDNELKEIVVTSSFGKVQLVPARGVTSNTERHTRTVIARTPNSFTLEWNDRGVGSRYGRNVYVRCG